MSGYLRVRNYENLQHYRDRRPDWIKYKVSLLDDHELAALPVPARLLYSLLLLFASVTDNNIPNDIRVISARTLMEPKQVKEGVESLLQAGFLSTASGKRSASAGIARKRVAATKKLAQRREETEREIETEKKDPKQKQGAVDDARTPDNEQPLPGNHTAKIIDLSLKGAAA